MRVLMLTSSYPTRTGDWRGGFVRDLARALNEQGLEVMVAAPRPDGRFDAPVEAPGDPKTHWLPAWFPVRSSAFHRAGLEANLIRDPAAVRSLPAFLAAYLAEARVLAAAADVLVAHWLFPMGLVGRLLSRWTGLPLGVVAHSGPPWPARLPGLRGLVRAVVRGSASTACVSAHVLEEIAAVAGDRGRLVVLPLGTTPRASAEPPPLDRRPLRVLFVGRMIRLKGADLVVRAASRFGESGGDWVQWTLVGDGPERAGLDDLAARGSAVRPDSANAQIRFCGELDHDATLAEIARHDVVVIPSRTGPLGRSEGLPRVLFEAWSRGVPVIASDTGGLGAAIRESGAGLLFRPESIEELADAVRRFRRDAELRRHLRARALEAACAHSWAVLGPRWADWVRTLAA